jgi:hypothetical protein
MLRLDKDSCHKHFLVKLLVYVVTDIAFLFTPSLTKSLSIMSAYTAMAVSTTEPQSPMGLLHSVEQLRAAPAGPPFISDFYLSIV